MDANKNKEGTFTVINEDGKEIIYDILLKVREWGW